MHQILIQSNKISHPIEGDYKYVNRFQNRMISDNFGCENLFLNASSLQFIHSITKNEVLFTTTHPVNWNFIFEKFNWEL